MSISDWQETSEQRSIEARTDLSRRRVGCEEAGRQEDVRCCAGGREWPEFGRESRLLRRGCSGRLRMMMGEQKRGAVRCGEGEAGPRYDLRAGSVAGSQGFAAAAMLIRKSWALSSVSVCAALRARIRMWGRTPDCLRCSTTRRPFPAARLESRACSCRTAVRVLCLPLCRRTLQEQSRSRARNTTGDDVKKRRRKGSKSVDTLAN